MIALSNERLQAVADAKPDAVAPGLADYAVMAAELLKARRQIAALEKQLMTPVKLPFISASPVCEIEAGYAAGVSDCKTAIRQAGFLIEGDE
ncbi:hypothetical protein ACP26E_11815 [Franconibacter pulveris 601]|uniref:hypothetical protein n=1 Tax=Franconibacter pulveris TaxID=435910 RepID=UPI000A6647FF